MKNVLVASGNQGKIKEFVALFEDLDLGIVVRSLSDFPDINEPDEPFETFEQNAVHKAQYYARQTGLPTLADDSGLEVDALDGQPGVYSARYAGVPKCDARNNAKLLDAMKGIESRERSARFRCVLAFVDVEGAPHTFDGSVEGMIATSIEGKNGFGYDVLFVPEGHSHTFGVLDTELKKGISHRARALRKFAEWFSSKN